MTRRTMEDGIEHLDERMSELLSAYLDGEVTATERAEAQRLLESNSAARELLEDLRRNTSALQSLPRTTAPIEIAERVRQRIERGELVEAGDSTVADHTGSPWFRFVAMAATLALVVAGVWFVANLQPPVTPGESQSLVLKEENDRARGLSSEPSEVGYQASADGRGQKAAPEGKGQENAIALVATAGQKLALGARPAELVDHPFGNESIHLTVAADNELARNRHMRAFDAALGQLNVPAVNDSLTESAGAFQVAGKPGVNFDDGQQRQILVRLPASHARALLHGMAESAGSAEAALNVGPIAVQGWETTTEMFSRIGGAQVAYALSEPDTPAPSEVSASDQKLFDELGLSTVFSALASKDAPTEDRVAGRQAASSPARAGAPERASSDANDEDLDDVKKEGRAPVDRRSSLTQRRLAALEEAESKSATEGAAASDDAIAGVALGESPIQAGTSVAGLAGPAPTDEYVTFVVTFTVKESAQQPRPVPPTNAESKPAKPSSVQ